MSEIKRGPLKWIVLEPCIWSYSSNERLNNCYKQYYHHTKRLGGKLDTLTPLPAKLICRDNLFWLILKRRKQFNAITMGRNNNRCAGWWIAASWHSRLHVHNIRQMYLMNIVIKRLICRRPFCLISPDHNNRSDWGISGCLFGNTQKNLWD